MKKLILACALLFVAQFAWALAPYVQAGKLSEPDLPARLGALESKLQAQGFKVVGRHQPKGIPGQATLVVTDPGILDAIRAIGGSAVVASGIRVAVLKDGSVSYMNPEYWYRAYLRDQYKSAEPAVKAARVNSSRPLAKASHSVAMFLKAAWPITATCSEWNVSTH